MGDAAKPWEKMHQAIRLLVLQGARDPATVNFALENFILSIPSGGRDAVPEWAKSSVEAVYALLADGRDARQMSEDRRKELCEALLSLFNTTAKEDGRQTAGRSR